MLKGTNEIKHVFYNKKNIKFYKFNNNFNYCEQNNESVKILLTASNNNYWYYCSTLIESIILNTNSSIEFIVIYSKINFKKIKKYLKKFNKNKKCFFNFVQMDYFIDNSEKCITNSMSYRFYIFLKNFKSLSKIIYLDCDIIVNDDIFKLWNINIDSYCLAAVKDYYFIKNSNLSFDDENYKFDKNLTNIESIVIPQETKKYIKKYLNINVNNYINSGVLLINCKKCRDKNLYEEYLKFNKKYIFNDQDFINIKLSGEIKFIENSYNFFSLFYNTNFSFDNLYINHSFTNPPTIIHYAGRKPRLIKIELSKNSPNCFFWNYFKKSHPFIFFLIPFYYFYKKIIIFFSKILNFFIFKTFLYLTNKWKQVLHFFILKFKKYYTLFFIKKLSTHSKESKEKRDVLIFLDTQNALGDFFSLFHFLLCINLQSKLDKNFYFLVPEKVKFIIQKIEWNKNINFIYKKISSSLGSHYEYNSFFKQFAKFKKIFNEHKNYWYENVFFFLPWISIDSMALIQGISFQNFFKIKFKDSLIKRYFSDIVPIPNEIISRNFINNLTSNQTNYIDIDNSFFWNKHNSEVAMDIWNRFMNEKIIFNFHSLTNFFEREKKGNYLDIIFLVNRPEERTIHPKFIIELLNQISESKRINVIFLGLEKDKNTINNFLKNIRFNFKNLIGKTENLEDFMNIINKANLIFGIDSSIQHISCILNKKIVTFVNSSSVTYKYLYNFWLKYPKNKNLKIVLNSEYFLYKENHISEYMNQNNQHVYKRIKEIIIDFIDGKEMQERIEINRNF